MKGRQNGLFVAYIKTALFLGLRLYCTFRSITTRAPYTSRLLGDGGAGMTIVRDAGMMRRISPESIIVALIAVKSQTY